MPAHNEISMAARVRLKIEEGKQFTLVEAVYYLQDRGVSVSYRQLRYMARQGAIRCVQVMKHSATHISKEALDEAFRLI
jgi:hypothetical protein